MAYGSAVAILADNLNNSRTQSYTYDEMNRLATAQSQATSGTDCWGLGYGYDRYANLLSESVTKCTGPTLSLSIDSTTNKITNTGFTYDAAGDLTADGVGGTFTWNAAGLMAATAGVTYTYDGDGRRVKKSNGKLYWYGLGGQVLAESDTSGNITSEYIFFGGMRIARRDVSSGNFYYFLGDRLGNARVVTDSSGTVVEASDYYPFGQERVVTGTGTANNYKYTGHEHDTESGLDHTHFRQGSSATGRWLSADPVRGKPENPQSWNGYTYVQNNPCNATDPDGSIILIPQPPLFGFLNPFAPNTGGFNLPSVDDLNPPPPPDDSPSMRAEEFLPDSAERAIKALTENEDCRKHFHFQGDNTPEKILRDMVSNVQSHGGIFFADNLGFDAKTFPDSSGSKANISIEARYGFRWADGDTDDRARLLIHELGHVFNDLGFLKEAGGSDFVTPDSDYPGQLANFNLEKECIPKP